MKKCSLLIVFTLLFFIGCNTPFGLEENIHDADNSTSVGQEVIKVGEKVATIYCSICHKKITKGKEEEHMKCVTTPPQYTRAGEQKVYCAVCLKPVSKDALEAHMACVTAP